MNPENLVSTPTPQPTPDMITQGGVVQQPNTFTPNEPVGTKKHGGLAVASLILGIMGLIAWFIPLFGAPITIAGLTLGIIGLKSTKREVAIAAIVLSSIGLLLTIVNASVGAYMGATGQNAIVNKLLNKGSQGQQLNITNLSPTNESNSKFEIINQGVQELKSQITLPNQVDKNTKLVNITAEPNAIRYYYVLSGVDVSNLSNDTLKSYLVPNICKENSLLTLLNQDINLEYSYSVENSQQTYLVSVTKVDCK